MIYHIHITQKAERDITGAADYIEFSLKNPSAADKLLDTVDHRISELAMFPEAHPVVDDPVLSAWGIRFLVIDGYLAFYIVSGNIVYVVRFIFGKRDWISILRKDFHAE